MYRTGAELNNRALAAVLAVCILLVAGFAVFITGGDDRVKEEKWYNVEIIDNVYPSYSSMSYQDNFYAYANEAYYLAGLEAGDKDEAMKIISANSVNNSF